MLISFEFFFSYSHYFPLIFTTLNPSKILLRRIFGPYLFVLNGGLNLNGSDVKPLIKCVRFFFKDKLDKNIH